MNSICTKVPIRRPLLQAVAVLGITAGLLAGSPSPAWAGTAGPPVPDTDGTAGGVCMVERFQLTKPSSATDLNCTSNDVQLAQYSVVSGPAECLEGQDVTLTLQGEFVATSDQRWDVGVFIHENGGTPNSLPSSDDDTCYSDYLHPVSATNDDLNLTGGTGPFYNGEITEDPTDTCGDIEQGQNAFFNTAEITIKCQDVSGDGTADVGTCTVWANSRSTGEAGNPSCIDQETSYDIVNGSPAGPTPGGGMPQGVTAETTAKCTCGNVEIAGLTVLKIGNLEVIKEVLPEGFVYTGDSFTLQIDADTEDEIEVVNVQDGGTTGKQIVSAGSSSSPGVDHTVGEIAGTDTDLANYVTSIECVDRDPTDVRASGTDSGPLTVRVNPDDDIVCTITNSLMLAMVEVNKTQSGVPAAGFTFQIRQGADGSNSGDILATGVTDAEGFTDFDAFKLLPGETYQLCEVAMMPGWSNTIDGFTPNGEVPEGGDNSSECVDFTAGDPGATTVFEVDNTPPPGGDARTIGFWKNWTSCDGHGNQDPVLDETLTLAGGTILLGGFAVTNCYDAVDLLDKRDIANSDAVLDGKKKAGDAAYGLAAQLLAAQLNVVANASDCTGSIDTTIAAANDLLEGISFDGTGNYLKGGSNGDDRALANELAGILDDYNNNCAYDD